MATLFVSGDVMTGRGVDQILPFPAKPRLFEAGASSALDYVALGESAHGPIARAVPFDYVWGDLLGELERRRPDARIVNLETAITTSDSPWPAKGIHYRMDPANAQCLAAARIDCCVLANNHVMDWGYAGLRDTIATLRDTGIVAVGAGNDSDEAAAPAVLPLPAGGRVVVFAFAMESSGVSAQWAAAPRRAGVNLLPDLSARSIDAIATMVDRHKAADDIVVFSVHWGSNWGHAIGRDERWFAHALVEQAGVDVVHGHSSHHPKAIEVHRDRPILYGCGDLINDYEGIGGHDEFSPDIALAYFLDIDDDTRKLRTLELVPFRIRRFRLERAPGEVAAGLRRVLGRECAQFGVAIEPHADGSAGVRWKARKASPVAAAF